MERRINKANLTAGNSEGAFKEAFAEARLSEEPGAGKLHAGIRGGGQPGNWLSYPDGAVLEARRVDHDEG